MAPRHGLANHVAARRLRTDDQVKHRGHHVEPAEVARALTAALAAPAARRAQAETSGSSAYTGPGTGGEAAAGITVVDVGGPHGSV